MGHETTNRTAGVFNYVDEATLTPNPWINPRDLITSFKYTTRTRPVTDIRENPENFSLDTSGFEFHHAPCPEEVFSDDDAICSSYYPEVEALIRSKIPGVRKVIVLQHSVRRHNPLDAINTKTQPLTFLHCDYTVQSGEESFHRRLSTEQIKQLRGNRYQIINVWRPIGHAASDIPLACIDWRSMKPEDLVKVELLRNNEAEKTPVDPNTGHSTGGKRELYFVLPNDDHKLCFVKDMTPDEAFLLKFFDSWSELQPDGKAGVAPLAPHSAFHDAEATPHAKPRQSIEVRSCVFFDE